MRRDRNHPSVFMWSMGNEEGQANTEKGLLHSDRDEGARDGAGRLAAGVDRAPPARSEPAAWRCAT